MTNEAHVKHNRGTPAIANAPLGEPQMCLYDSHEQLHPIDLLLKRLIGMARQTMNPYSCAAKVSKCGQTFRRQFRSLSLGGELR